jgi:hypothetical protein
MIAHGLPLGLPADFLGTRGDILMDIVILPLIVFNLGGKGAVVSTKSI